jgi:CheY-like chemotaxis protein
MLTQWESSIEAAMESPSVYMCSAEPPDTVGGPGPRPPIGQPGPLQGSRILVIEDEFLIATVIEDVLRQAGAEEVLIAVNMQEARAALAEHTLDIAMIDMQLDEGSESGVSLGKLAMARNIPFIFLTGYTRVVLPDGFSAVPVLTKPYIPRTLIEALSDVLARSRGSDP